MTSCNPTSTPAPAEDVGSVAYQALMQDRRELLQRTLGLILRRPDPLTLEVGCGHGHFLTAYAQANPAKLCIGIDLVGERISRALRKRDRAKLENLFFIRTEAALFLEMLPENARVAELFILFPDPWPKSRHHKHRILRNAFLTAAAARMVDNGLVCFRTDFKPYFDEAERVIREHTRWSHTTEPWPFEHTTVFQGRAPTYYSMTARTTVI